MKYQKVTGLLSTIFLTVLCFSGSALAHFPWINLSDYSPGAGSRIQGTIGWGHHYPLDGFLKAEAVEKIMLVDPAGEESALSFSSDLEWHAAEGLSAGGGYLVYAERKPGFYTKTTRGGRSVSKKGLEGVISCSYSHMSMKAVATRGAEGDVSAAAGLPIEIMPLDNPATLKPGDYLHVRLLLDGKPHRGQIFGTYAGFSADSNTFAYATETDADGLGRIRILHPGLWLLKSSFEKDYGNSDECDVERFSTTLTFEVQ